MKSKEHERLMRLRRKCFDKDWHCLDWGKVEEIDKLIDEEDERIERVFQKFLDNIRPVEA
jgi:hypothetical protein